MRIVPKVMSSQWRMDECCDAALRAVVFSHTKMPTDAYCWSTWSALVWSPPFASY